jgi:transposase
MEKELVFDARKLSPGEQETLRKKIVREMLKQEAGKRGATKEVAAICECSLSHVQSTWKKYRDHGVKGIKATQMGRPENSGKLTKEQQAKIQSIIVDKSVSCDRVSFFAHFPTALLLFLNYAALWQFVKILNRL